MGSRSDITKTSPPASGRQARAEPRCGAALPRWRLLKMVRSWWAMIRTGRSGAFPTMGSDRRRDKLRGTSQRMRVSRLIRARLPDDQQPHLDALNSQHIPGTYCDTPSMSKPSPLLTFVLLYAGFGM